AGDEVTEIVLDICDQYTIQADLFARAVLDDTPVPTPLADAVANMRVIDAVRESARTGAWVTPGSGAGR
ncbi:MAG TPA: Gfo/Idh/MocA family oxidoreductase, partial [Chloroflexia bacterium]